jgi:hypothetical protein
MRIITRRPGERSVLGDDQAAASVDPDALPSVPRAQPE